MRSLDIGVAAGYALLCIGVIVTTSPYAADAGRAQVDASSKAYAAVASFVQERGIIFLYSSTARELCSSLASRDNSSLVLGGSIDGVACSPPPAEYLADSSLMLDLGDRRVQLEAWVVQG